MKNMLKFAVSGPSGCGKDEFAVAFAEAAGFVYTKSTSEYASREVFVRWGSWQGYEDERACWEDRRNHKDTWADIMDDMNAVDGAHVYRLCVKEQDVLTGIRRFRQFKAVKDAGLVSLWIWIERPGVEKDPNLEYGPGDCDVVIANDGTVEDLRRKAVYFAGMYQSFFTGKGLLGHLDRLEKGV